MARACALQCAASAAWKRAVASGARLRPAQNGGFSIIDPQVEQLVRALDKKAGRTDKVGLPLSPRSRKAAEAAEAEEEEAGQAAASEEKAKEKAEASEAREV